MKKEILIKNLNNVNIKNFSIMGGVAHFNKLFPNLLKYINEYTKEIQIYPSNKKLPAKILFLQKYNGDINKIKIDNKLMIYDSKLCDFKKYNLNAAKKQWDLCNDELSKIVELYSKIETINLLKNKYKIYYGKSGNRKLLRDDKKLYLSLLYYTSHLNLLNKNLNKLSMRLYILINNIDIYCHKHNVLKFWRINKGEFSIICGKCEPKYPSINWFKKTYCDNWNYYYNERKENVKINKTNSIEWFQRKFGTELGIIKYKEHVNIKMNKLSILKANRYSKISQELFWNIYDNIDNKNNIYFTELNKEFVLRIPEKFNYDKTVMMLDFKQNNKVIEYNGTYWHSNDIDDIRYSILKDMGFEIMFVTSEEYNRNNKNNEIINKCVKFLQC